jgi:hypothetical protein
MYNLATSGIVTEISKYKLAFAVDQNHVSIQKVDTSGKIRKQRRKYVGKR